jgi:hypothetical protein
MTGMAWYHANGCANHTAISNAKIKVASFQRLKRTKPLSRAAIIGGRKVRRPIDVLGFTVGTSQPNANPEIPPHRGPRKGAVNAEETMLDKVITTDVPKTGYAGIHAHTSNTATHVAARVTSTVLVKYLGTKFNQFLVSFFANLCKLLHNLNKTFRTSPPPQGGQT